MDANDKEAKSDAKPRSAFARWVKPVLIFVALVVIPLAIAIPAYQGYRPRQLVNEDLAEGLVLRTRIAESYEARRRLPQASEAEAFQVSPSELGRAQSVVWDAAGRRIVVTVDRVQPGKRFAFYAEERDGTLAWSCRTIDLEAKYLPASCR